VLNLEASELAVSGSEDAEALAREVTALIDGNAESESLGSGGGDGSGGGESGGSAKKWALVRNEKGLGVGLRREFRFGTFKKTWVSWVSLLSYSIVATLPVCV
jgi:hypothetical protein